MTDEIETIIKNIYDKFDGQEITNIPNVILENLFSKIQTLGFNDKKKYKKFFIDKFISNNVLFRDSASIDYIDDSDSSNGSVIYDTDDDTDDISDINKVINDLVCNIDNNNVSKTKIRKMYGDFEEYKNINCKKCLFNFKINKIGTSKKIIQLAYLQLDQPDLVIVTYNFDNGEYKPNDLCEEPEDIFNSTKVPISILYDILTKLQKCETIYVFNKKLTVEILNENFSEHGLETKMVCLRTRFELMTIFDINIELTNIEPIGKYGTITDLKKVSSNYIKIMYEICRFNGITSELPVNYQ